MLSPLFILFGQDPHGWVLWTHNTSFLYILPRRDPHGGVCTLSRGGSPLNGVGRMNKKLLQVIKGGREDIFYNSRTWRKKRLDILERDNF